MQSPRLRDFAASMASTQDLHSHPPEASNQSTIFDLGTRLVASATSGPPIQHIDILDSIPFRTRPGDQLLICHPLTPSASHSPCQSRTAHLSSHLLWYLHSRLNALSLSRWESGQASKEELRARRVSWEVVNAALMRRLDGKEGERGVDGVFRVAPGMMLRVVDWVNAGEEIGEAGEAEVKADAPTVNDQGGSERVRRYSGAGERRQSRLNQGAVFTEGDWDSCREDHLKSIEKRGRDRVTWAGRGKARRAGRAQNPMNPLLFDGMSLGCRLDQGELRLHDAREKEWARCAQLIRFNEAIPPAPEQLLEIKAREPVDIWDVLCPGQYSDL